MNVSALFAQGQPVSWLPQFGSLPPWLGWFLAGMIAHHLLGIIFKR